MFSSLFGRQGDQGDKGDQGDQGNKGDKGDQGDAGTSNYVDRGDPAAYDFSVGVLTTDGNWHDLDLSSIIPEGTVLVHLFVFVSDDTPNVSIALRKKGNSNSYNMSVCGNHAANVHSRNDVMVVPDANRKIEYWTSNNTFTQLDIIVRGWWV